MSEEKNEEVLEDIPAADPTHPDHDLEEDFVDDSDPVELGGNELDDLDFDSVDVENVPVLVEGDDD